VIGLAYTDARGRVFFDESSEPLADAGVLRAPERPELIPAPKGTVAATLPSRNPVCAGGRVASRRTAMAAFLPSGYTRLLLPAYRSREDAPPLPLFGYTFACVIDDALHVAAMRTDEADDWTPRYFSDGELEAAVRRRRASDPSNRVLAQLERCACEYGCFTAQNVFLERGEAALPASPRCNARCIGCISELDEGVGFPAPQTRVAYETSAAELARIAVAHLERVEGGIVSFGQGCEGEPLLRPTTIRRAIERIRASRANGTVNCNTNGSRPKALAQLIDAGLDAVRVSLNSFRDAQYAAYYRPLGYGLNDVFESIRLAASHGLRVSLNLLTHPGVTDDAEEVRALEAFLGGVRVDMIQTRTLNIDPERYFAAVGRPSEPLGMRVALGRIRAAGVRVGNFTHTH
jgi:pyruvate-formate lyase-activating enzyme